MIKCKFLNYREESNFQRDLNAGNIPEGAIAFIHNPRYVWARGMYYPCSSLSDTEIADIERRVSESIEGDINTLVENLIGSINEALAGKADKSDIPTVPKNVGAFVNDAGYLTQHQDISSKVDRSELDDAAFNGKVEWDNIQNKPTNIGGTEQVQADWEELNQTSKSYIQNKPALATVATTGSYDDLSNKPTIPMSTNDLTNDSGFITSEQLKTINNESLIGTGNINIFSGATSYNDLDDKPEFKTINNESIVGNGNIEISSGLSITLDTNLSETSENAVLNKTIYYAIKGIKDNLKWTDIQGRPTVNGLMITADADISIPDPQVLANWDETNRTSLAYIQNKPTIPSVDSAFNAQSPNALANNTITEYKIGTDLAISTINETISALKAVATSGEYSDLTGKPDIPSNIAELTNIDVLKTITLESLGGAKQLIQLSDTDISSPQAGQALVYITQNGEGKWINGTPTDPFFIKLALVAGGAQPGSWNGIEVNNNFFDLNGDGTVNTDDLTVASDLRNYALGFVADYAKNFYGKTFLMQADLNTYATQEYVGRLIDNLIDGAPDTLNTLKEIAAALDNDENAVSTILTELSKKANDSDLKAVAKTGDYGDLINTPSIPKDTRDLTNGAGFLTEHQQLKTINNESVVGEGNIKISLVQSDWNQSVDTAKDYIKNKPTLSVVATSGSYEDLLNKPSVVTSQELNDKLLLLYNIIVDNFVLKADVPYTGGSATAPIYNPAESAQEEP